MTVPAGMFLFRLTKVVKIKAGAKVSIGTPETMVSGNTTVNGLLTYTAGLSAVNSGGW